MATVVKSMATTGVEGFMVEIEASTIRGQQQMMSIIGLPDQAIKEAGERIQAAIESCGYDIPKDKVILSLAPHHNVSLNALIGGGSYAQPGEVSLAHNGVLFLDEIAEFSKSTLDALRQPMEDKRVTISRVNGTNSYPANFMFVAAMNPCPCGYYPSKKCRCTDYEIIHYRGKISGPILERIDIQKSVAHVDYFELSERKSGRTSDQLRKIVEQARTIQQERFKNAIGVNCNAQMPPSMIQRYCRLDDECTKMLKDASEKYGYSARVIHKLLRLARTCADIELSEKIRPQDVARALSCRDLDVSSSRLYTI